ncbi:hypothetical protein FAZ69_27045 [Trinickia terrae]|uniref:Uncharacterized protein n=1 Tax=Trinickia terrae TaxID=2571161 RepID=A0A4U1HPB4_9BURK|nr:hypothetical protein [Trinickia terrae]TKC81627.1 hypothetical protein FAZ69_27045 [Trinickia terrae]
MQRLFNGLYARAACHDMPLGEMACEAAVLQLAAHLRKRLVPSQRTAASEQSIRHAKERIDTDPSAPVTQPAH